MYGEVVSSSAEHPDAISTEAMAATIAALQAEMVAKDAEHARQGGRARGEPDRPRARKRAAQAAAVRRQDRAVPDQRAPARARRPARGRVEAAGGPRRIHREGERRGARRADPSGKGKAGSHGRRNLDASKLPRVPIEIRDLALEARGARLIRFDDSNQIAFRRGGFFIVVKRVAQYEVVEQGVATVVPAPAPETLFPKALLHTSTVAHILTSKFALGVPHYRLERDLLDQGMRLDRGLMSRYVEHAGNTLGATIVAAMWRDAIANGQMISDRRDRRADPADQGQGRQVARVQEGTLLYRGCRRRRRAVRVRRAPHQRCGEGDLRRLSRLAPSRCELGLRDLGARSPARHRRRHHAPRVLGALQTLLFRGGPVSPPRRCQGLMRIRAMYAVDAAGRRVPRDERTAFRATHLRPLMDDFFTWAASARDLTPGRNLATKALGYALNQEAELRNVLLDGAIPLDNTRAERALRKIVVGRKAWMFYGTDTHAEAAAAIFSIIATCRLHGIDPFVYLDEVLRVLPYWPHDRYLELAPQHWLATRARLDPTSSSVRCRTSRSRQSASPSSAD